MHPPGAVAPVLAAHEPTAEEVEAAERVLAAHREATAAGRGVVVVDGRVVDEPVVAQARSVLRTVRRAT